MAFTVERQQNNGQKPAKCPDVLLKLSVHTRRKPVYDQYLNSHQLCIIEVLLK